jgi:pyrroloquinoline quinone biosynthesis protein E
MFGEILKAIKERPIRSLGSPELIHIELTTRCPLRCPQCYCNLTNGKDIDLLILYKLLEEAARIGVSHIALSGGEPLVYPYLEDVVKKIDDLGMYSGMSTSGHGLTDDGIKKLKAAGLKEIFVSINGSTKEIHHKSRDGYKEGINALKLLKKNSLKYNVNWVARKDNVKDFPKLVELCKSYGVKGIYILVLKPDSQYQSENFLSRDDFLNLAEYVDKYDDPDCFLHVEPCYSYLHAYLNRDNQKNIGCNAGRRMMAIDVEANMMPCRHMFYPEKFNSINEYWHQSEILKKLRTIEENIKEPCKSCEFIAYCRCCRASCEKLYGDFFAGEKQCPMKKGFLN